MNVQSQHRRPRIAFFDYPDVFEDFYTHYGVNQDEFATRWAATGNHAFLSLLQREIGDVTWYSFSLAPQFLERTHEVVGCKVKMLSSSWLHRQIWKLFYNSRWSWRWRKAYPVYARVASYTALASVPFVRALLRDRPDFFFVQDYATGRFDQLVLAAKLLRIPIVAYHSGSSPERYIGRAVKHWTIPRCEKLLVSSRAEWTMLATRYKVAANRLNVVLTPIDTAAFRPMNRELACAKVHLDPHRRYVLYVGRLDDHVKRVSALIGAFKSVIADHSDVDLLIAGNGEDETMLRNATSEFSHGRVRFLGWSNGTENLASLYNCAECLVLPSRSEGFPTVVGEAMACGLPVLASRVGGVTEMVAEGRTGWTFAPLDDDALRLKLGFVLACPEQVRAMRPHARRMAENRVSHVSITSLLRESFAVNGYAR